MRGNRSLFRPLLLMALLAVLLLSALMRFGRMPASNIRSIPYARFLVELKANQFASVKIRDSTARAQLKSGSKTYTVALPRAWRKDPQLSNALRVATRRGMLLEQKRSFFW